MFTEGISLFVFRLEAQILSVTWNVADWSAAGMSVWALSLFLETSEASCSPAEGLGRTSIGPLSESDEEEERERRTPEERDGGTTSVFERDCTELDISLIEEN